MPGLLGLSIQPAASCRLQQRVNDQLESLDAAGSRESDGTGWRLSASRAARLLQLKFLRIPPLLRLTTHVLYNERSSSTHNDHS